MLAKMDVFVFIESVYCSTCFQIAIQVVPLWLLVPLAAMKKRALSAAPRLSGLYSTACSNNGGVQHVHCRLCSTGIIMRKSLAVLSLAAASAMSVSGSFVILAYSCSFGRFHGVTHGLGVDGVRMESSGTGGISSNAS